MEILHLTKLDCEGYKLNDDECACAGYEGYCATLVEPPRRPPSPPRRPPPPPPRPPAPPPKPPAPPPPRPF